MNPSISRIGLVLAAFAAIVTIGGFYVADGYLAARPAAPAVAAAVLATRVPSPSPAATLAPQVVYVRPAPSPVVIHVTRTAPPAAPPPPRVIHVTIPSVQTESGDNGDGGGGGD
jgi:hypothetical protein